MDNPRPAVHESESLEYFSDKAGGVTAARPMLDAGYAAFIASHGVTPDLLAVEAQGGYWHEESQKFVTRLPWGEIKGRVYIHPSPSRLVYCLALATDDVRQVAFRKLSPCEGSAQSQFAIVKMADSIARPNVLTTLKLVEHLLRNPHPALVGMFVRSVHRAEGLMKLSQCQPGEEYAAYTALLRLQEMGVKWRSVRRPTPFQLRINAWVSSLPFKLPEWETFEQGFPNGYLEESVGQRPKPVTVKKAWKELYRSMRMTQASRERERAKERAGALVRDSYMRDEGGPQERVRKGLAMLRDFIEVPDAREHLLRKVTREWIVNKAEFQISEVMKDRMSPSVHVAARDVRDAILRKYNKVVAKRIIDAIYDSLPKAPGYEAD